MKVVMPPMLEQACRFRGDLPLVGRQRTPSVYMATDLVDDRGGVVLLFASRKPFAFVKEEAPCFGVTFCFLGFGIGVMN